MMAIVHPSAAKVRGELFSLRPGDYTLVSDQDPTIGECALDLHIHFCCDGELLIVANCLLNVIPSVISIPIQTGLQTMVV